jgi:hypothetical protein
MKLGSSDGIVITAACRAEILVRRNTRSDASARMSDWNL